MLKQDLKNYIMDKTLKKRILLACHLDITKDCNLECKHCYVVKENRKEMKKSKILDILDQLANLGTLYLTLSGGEIFTREDFFEIAEYARQKHFALSILTNGTLIDEAIADKLSNLNPYKIHVSIYSMNPKIHDNITGVPGSLEKTMNAVKLLKDRNISFSISNTIMKENLDEYITVYETAKKLDAEVLFNPNITPKTDGNKLPLDYQISDDELFKILADPLLNLSLNENKEPINTNYPDIICDAAQNSCYISPFGDVLPCLLFPLLCGNLKEKDLAEIWYHSLPMLKASKLSMSNLPVCSKCEIKIYCPYCPGLSILEENDLFTPPTSCCKRAEILSKLR